MAWSLKHAASGVYPNRGFYNEELADNTYRKSLCGKRIAGNHKLLDSKWFLFAWYPQKCLLRSEPWLWKLYFKMFLIKLLIDFDCFSDTIASKWWDLVFIGKHQMYLKYDKYVPPNDLQEYVIGCSIFKDLYQPFWLHSWSAGDFPMASRTRMVFRNPSLRLHAFGVLGDCKKPRTFMPEDSEALGLLLWGRWK